MSVPLISRPYLNFLFSPLLCSSFCSFVSVKLSLLEYLRREVYITCTTKSKTKMSISRHRIVKKYCVLLKEFVLKFNLISVI